MENQTVKKDDAASSLINAESNSGHVETLNSRVSLFDVLRYLPVAVMAIFVVWVISVASFSFYSAHEIRSAIKRAETANIATVDCDYLYNGVQYHAKCGNIGRFTVAWSGNIVRGIDGPLDKNVDADFEINNNQVIHPTFSTASYLSQF